MFQAQITKNPLHKEDSGGDATNADERLPCNTSDCRMSGVENLAHKIEIRRDSRIPITLAVRKRFLKKCREMAIQRGFKKRVFLDDLRQFRDELREEVERDQNPVSSLLHWVGFPDESTMLLRVVDKGIERVTSYLEQEFLFFQDFSFYYTRLISRSPWLRSPLQKYVLTVLAFYIFAPVLFCWIVDDEDVCPDVPGKGPYAGWLTATYFASVTLSTVGYGNVTVEHTRWHVFAGTVFMVLSVVVLVTSISVSSSGNPLDKLHDWAMDNFVRNVEKEKFLYQLVRRSYIVKISLIAASFLVLNVMGVLLARIFVRLSEEESEQWTWMTTCYWAVQTTTTIGYGDLDMPFDMRWMQIIFLIFSTYFAGDSLGRLGSLSREIDIIRRRYAWDHREVSEGLIDDMRAEEHDDKLDQYEFALASLLVLQKVTHDDIKPIMDKFWVLAGGKDFISISDQIRNRSDRVDDSAERNGEFYCLYE